LFREFNVLSEGKLVKPSFLRILSITLALCGLLAAQTVCASAQDTQSSSQPATAGAAAHYDRVAAAKTVFLKNAGGDDIPFNVISRGFEGWGRYLLVDSADKADLIIEIQSPGDDSENKDSGQSKTNLTGGGAQQKQPPKPVTDVITLTVYDKNKRPLWIAREEPKSAVRRKAEETHLVEAAQKLFTRFHDRIEPPAKP
jgi:hypothetical protein